MLGAIIEQAENVESDYSPAPYVVPVSPEEPNTGPGAEATATLSGYWYDAEGGQYQVVQQGMQVAVQGSHPAGPVYGTGVIANNVVTLNYIIDGVPYGAQLAMNADGSLVGRYASNYSGLSGSMALQRSQ